jgi:hypothetical protein
VDPGAIELQVALPHPSAGSAYTINYGQPLTLNAANTTNPANSNLSYSWDVGGKGTFTLAGGKDPTISWSQLQAMGLGVGTTTVQVRVNDGYGGVNHTIVSQPVSLTILSTFQIATVSPAAPGSMRNPLATVDLTFTDPVDPSTLTAAGFLRLTHDRTSATPPRLMFTTVAGEPGVERLSGLSGLTAEGSYVLTFDASKLSDFYGAGVGQTSVTWTIDRTPSTSHVASLAASVTSGGFVVSVTGADPAPNKGVTVSGIASYDIYVSTDGSAPAYWTTVPALNPAATFHGEGGHSYGFQSIATDFAGNREVKPAAIEAATYVLDPLKPITQVTGVDSSNQKFVVSYAGPPGAGIFLDHIDIFAVVDGTAPLLIGKVTAASGTVNYEAIADGTSHTYEFYSIGVDRSGNIQPIPIDPDARVTVTATFAAPSSNRPIGLTIDHGAAGRSFVGSADLIFDNVTGLSALISGNHIHLVKHGLNGTGSTPVSRSGYQLSVVDHAIEFDFGAKGLGGSPTTTLGDGYYEIDVDGIAQSFYFDRILGDVSGDGTVDATDVNLVTEFQGRSMKGQAIDVDGSGTITSSDRIITLQATGHALAAGLRRDA